MPPSDSQNKRNTIVYAIGGTGAKCAEGLVHLSAAGVIDADWTLRIVDQDRDNGNGTRLVRLVALYSDVRNALRERQQALGDSCPLLRGQITCDKGIMAVLPDLEAILRESFHIGEASDPATDPNALLLNALFTDEERGERLVRGFAGRPGLGAAAFLCPQAEENSELWECVRDDVRAMNNGEVARVLLLGSMFGGTGAAGLPTLGRHFRSKIRNRNIMLGAVLLLRYFDLRDPGQFKPADHSRTRAALSYYEREMAPEGGTPLFDQLYLVGQHPEIIIPAEPSGGGKGQINPALLPELLAGLGAARFMRGTPADQQQDRRGVFICGRNKTDVVTWDDLPVANLDTRGGIATDLLIGLARFAVAYVYAFHCGVRLSALPNLEDLPAYQRFLDVVAVRDGSHDKPGEELVSLCEMYLEWFGACNLMEASGLKLQLADVSKLVANAVEPRPEQPKVVLACETADVAAGKRAALRQVKRAFRGLHRNGRTIQLHQVAAGMLAQPPSRSPGFCSFVEALYTSAACLPPQHDNRRAR